MTPRFTSMTEAELVEHVTKAITPPIMYEFDGWRLDKPVEWRFVSEKDREVLRNIARAAIAAYEEAHKTEPDEAGEAGVGMTTETVQIPREVFEFLMGRGALEGVWFGDFNTKKVGRFWWRNILDPYDPARKEALDQ